MAEHANNTGAGLPGLTGERLKAIATILVTLYSLANAGLNLAGVNTLPFTDEQVSAAIFAVIGVCGTIWGWWKNQNVTSAALAGQQLVNALKREGMVNGLTAAKSAAIGAASALADAGMADADEADEGAAGSMPESDDAPGEI